MGKQDKSVAVVLPDAEKGSENQGGSAKSGNPKDKPPENFWEFAWKWISESGAGVSWWGRFALVLVLGLTSETRELAMAMSARGWVECRRHLNWLVNHLNAAVQALLVGGSLIAAVGIVSLIASVQIPVWTERWRVMGLCMLVVTPILLWMYSQVMDITMRLGALGAALGVADAEDFKKQGGLNPINVVARVANKAVGGGLGAMWAVAKKMAWMGMWVYVGIMFPMIFPAHHVPDLLWLSTPLIFIQITLHTFREPSERGKEWGMLQRVTLMIFCILAGFWMVPEGILILTMQHGSMVSLVTRIVSFVVCLILILWAKYDTDQDMKKQHASNATGSETPAAVGTMDPDFYSKRAEASARKQGSSLVGVVGPAFLFLMVVAICATIIFLNISTEQFQRIVPLIHL